MIHRDEPLEIIDEEGTKRIYQCNKLHCKDGPAVTWADGSKEWYKNGKRHRIGKPAATSPIANSWFCQDMLHRLDGPAIEYHDGRVEWWLWDNLKTFDEFCQEIQISDEQKFLWKVQYGE